MKSLFVVLALICLQVVYTSASGHGYDQGYYKPPSTYCYQCAYSPPKTYYDKKVIVESKHYDGYQKKDDGYGHGHGHGGGGYGDDKHGYEGGYYKKTYVPVPYTVQGGWDKCKNGFDYKQAERFGIDVWECHSNCYVRVDKNKNVYRGCFKGEYGVNPYKLGCHKQAGSTYCFCEGSKCNNFDAPLGGYH